MTDTTEFSAASNKADSGLVTQTSRILANFQRFTSQPSFQRSFPAVIACLLYTSPSPRDKRQSRMPSSA